MSFYRISLHSQHTMLGSRRIQRYNSKTIAKIEAPITSNIQYIAQSVIYPRILSTIRSGSYDETWAFRDLRIPELLSLRFLLINYLQSEFTKAIVVEISVTPVFHVHVDKLPQYVVHYLEQKFMNQINQDRYHKETSVVKRMAKRVRRATLNIKT